MDKIIETIKIYYNLTKPGIIYGNAISAMAGYFYASHGHFYLKLFLGMLVGISLVIASGCVFNNYIDRKIDKNMKRTSRRALVTGEIKPLAALIYASLLSLIGFLVLGIYTNAVVVWIGVIGIVDYVIVYSISKRRSSGGTILGSICGATPITAGYCAVVGHIDLDAFLLFLLMVTWQMPHFYAIAMFRSKDYKAAKLPVLPVQKGNYATKQSILAFCIFFIAFCAMLRIYGHAGFMFVLITIPLGLWWLWRAMTGFKAKDDVVWARSMFRASLVVLLISSVMLSVARVLP